MSQNDDVFDAELEAKLREIADGVAIEAVPADAIPSAPLVTDQQAFTLQASEQWFSALFWKPETVPDFPVRKFKATEWAESVRVSIPKMPPFWQWPKADTEAFAFAMYMQDRTLLHGPTGTGKSALPKAYCAHLGIPYILVSCHQQQEASDFLGKDNIRFNPETQHLDLSVELASLGVAVRDGGMIVVDEAFRSPILMAIQSLLEPGGALTLPDAAGMTVEERRLQPPEGKHWIVLTDNTNGQGSEDGRYNAEVQDLSTLDRITSTIYIDYPSSDLEDGIMAAAAPALKPEHRKTLLTIIGLVRVAFKRGTIQQPISIRAGTKIAQKAQYLGAAKAFKQCYVNKLGTTDLATFKEIWHQATAQDFAA